MAQVEEEVAAWLEEAEATDAAEDEAYGERRGDELPAELAGAVHRREKLRAAARALAESGQRVVSVTDPEAPLQRTREGKRPGYNCQVAVDDHSGFIVAEEATTSQADNQEFGGMARQVEENLGEAPAVMSADAGYYSAETLVAAEEREAEVYVVCQGEPPAGRYGPGDFRYDAEGDEYLCPEGRALVFRGRKRLRATEYRRYRAWSSCRSCPRRERCIPAKGRYRELLVSGGEKLAEGMRARVASEAGRAVMRRPRATVERVFGLMKSVLGLRQFLLRGLQGARIELTLCALGVNLRQLTGHWRLARSALTVTASPMG
jgi:hypothetical protein